MKFYEIFGRVGLVSIYGGFGAGCFPVYCIGTECRVIRFFLHFRIVYQLTRQYNFEDLIFINTGLANSKLIIINIIDLFSTLSLPSSSSLP